MLQDERRRRLGIWSVVMLIVTPLVALVYYDNYLKFFAVLAVICGTIFYHLAIRLGISWFVAYMPEDYFNFRLRFYKLKPFERKLYHKIRIKLWEDYLPDYMAKDFQYEKEKGNEEEVLFNMCEDEMIHALNAIASFLSIIIGIIAFPGGWIAFLVSGLLLTVWELAFVASQRFDSDWLVRSSHVREKENFLR